MLSEEKEINDSAAPFLVFLFGNAINIYKVLNMASARPRPGGLRLSTLHLAKSVSPFPRDPHMPSI